MERFETVYKCRYSNDDFPCDFRGFGRVCGDAPPFRKPCEAAVRGDNRAISNTICTSEGPESEKCGYLGEQLASGFRRCMFPDRDGGAVCKYLDHPQNMTVKNPTRRVCEAISRSSPDRNFEKHCGNRNQGRLTSDRRDKQGCVTCRYPGPCGYANEIKHEMRPLTEEKHVMSEHACGSKHPRDCSFYQSGNGMCGHSNPTECQHALKAVFDLTAADAGQKYDTGETKRRSQVRQSLQKDVQGQFDNGEPFACHAILSKDMAWLRQELRDQGFVVKFRKTDPDGYRGNRSKRYIYLFLPSTAEAQPSNARKWARRILVGGLLAGGGYGLGKGIPLALGLIRLATLV